MWFLLILLLVAARGGVCDEEECMEVESAKCDKSNLPKEIPQTLDQYDTDCGTLLAHFDCMSDALDKCGDESHEGQMLRSGIFYVRRRICNPESHIYEIFRSNLECVVTGLPKAKEVCQGADGTEMQKKVTDAVGDYVLEKQDTVGMLPNGRICLDSLSSVACNTVLLEEECGIPVADAYLDMSNNIVGNLRKCSEEALNDLPFLVNNLRDIAHEGGSAEFHP